MHSIVQNILYLSAIFIPLTFTTINSELFEFPKFILLLSGTLTILTAWIIDLLINKKTLDPKYFVNNPISVAVLAVLATQLIATIFSINPYTSFWGYYSRYHQGLLTTICYTVIYFAATIYLDKKSVLKLIKMSVGAAFVISLYAIAQRLGVDKSLWIQDVVNRPFSTLGQPNWLAAYLLPNLFLTLYLLQTKQTKNNYVLCTVYYVLILTAILLTKSRSGFIALALSYLVYFSLLARQFTFQKIKKSFLLCTMYCVLCTLLIGTPYTPSLKTLIQTQPEQQPELVAGVGTQLENGGTESGDIRKIVWSGAIQLIKKYPFLGTGPETFAYTYYWVRPVSHNNTSEWDFLYNKSHNEYLNLAATTGLLGLLAYLYFHFAVFKISFTTVPKSKKINQTDDDYLRHIYPVLGAAITSFAITNFFGFSVIPVYLIMILISTLPTALNNTYSRLLNISLPSTMYYVLIFLPLLYPAKIFLADVAYARGKAYLDATQPAVALPLLQKASLSRPGLDLYHSALGEAYALLGQSEQAVKEAELTKRLNPYHLNFHKSRAKIYLTLASHEASYYLLAASELEDARAKAPSDPKLAYNLGLVYTRMGKNTEASELFRSAIDLKPNYESPYYALTLLYEQTDQKDLIPELLSGAKQNLATYSAALKEKIDKYAR